MNNMNQQQQETTIMCLVSMFSKLTIDDCGDYKNEQTHDIKNTKSAYKMETTVTEQPIEQQQGQIVDEEFDVLIEQQLDNTTDKSFTDELTDDSDSEYEYEINRHFEIGTEYRRFKQCNSIFRSKKPFMDNKFINKNYQIALEQCVSECDGLVKATQFGWTVDCYLAIRKLQKSHFKTEKKINKIVNKYFADGAECKLLEYTYRVTISPMKSLDCIADTMGEDIYYEMLYHKNTNTFNKYYAQLMTIVKDDKKVSMSEIISQKVKRVFKLKKSC